MASSAQRRIGAVERELRRVQTISFAWAASRVVARRTISIAFCRFTVNITEPPAFNRMLPLLAGRNRGIVTFTEYSPANRFTTENEPRLSVKAILSGMTGDAAATIIKAPTSGDPVESWTCPWIAARSFAAIARIGQARTTTSPRAILRIVFSVIGRQTFDLRR